MDSPRDNFLSRLAHAATQEDWDKVREIVDEDKRRQCFLAYDQAKYFGIRFNCARTAKILGVNERTIRRWIKDLEELDKPKAPPKRHAVRRRTMRDFDTLLGFGLSFGLLLFELFDFWQ